MNDQPHSISAEEIMGAALELGLHDDLLEEFLEDFGVGEWTRRRNKAYPDCYAFAERYRCNPLAVARLRREISTVPRVRPEDYDILFNVEGSHPYLPGPTWDVVKWMPMPEWLGWLPGAGWTAVVLLEPFPVYGIPAARSPLSLGDWDFNQLRQNATTRGEGGKGLSEELLRNNLRKQAERRAAQESVDLDFAEYYRGVFKRQAEELGI